MGRVGLLLRACPASGLTIRACHSIQLIYADVCDLLVGAVAPETWPLCALIHDAAVSTLAVYEPIYTVSATVSGHILGPYTRAIYSGHILGPSL